MYTIKNIAEGDTYAYSKVKDGLEFAFNSQIYSASSALHQAIDLLWLLPDTEKREALREKLYTISDELSDTLDKELADYQKEWERH